MADFIQYITKDGERWDTISHIVYGTSTMMDKLIAANPNVVIEDRLPVGIILEIPVIAETTNPTPLELLPPWKR